MNRSLSRLRPNRPALLEPEAVDQPSPGRAPVPESLLEILDLVSEGIVVMGAGGEIAFRNATAERLLAPLPSNALALAAVEELAAEAVRTLSPQERRLELVSPTRRDLLIRAYPLADGAVAAVVRDVSERQRLEAIRRDFVANVSHELKTPVGALSLLAETLDGEEDADVVIRLAGRIGAEAERLVRIIDDLLDLSRIEANESAQKETVPVDSLLRQAVEPLVPLARSNDIELRLDPLAPGPAVLGDRRDLVSAVSNLVDNAIKYSEPGGAVTISARMESQWVEVSVADGGMGIPARDLERIFERFYRVDRARSRLTGGTGLGLSIVRHVVANHGGTVSVQSVEGEGSTFVLRLPLSPQAGDEIVASPDPQAAAGPGASPTTPSTAATSRTAVDQGPDPANGRGESAGA